MHRKAHSQIPGNKICKGLGRPKRLELNDTSQHKLELSQYGVDDKRLLGVTITPANMIIEHISGEFSGGNLKNTAFISNESGDLFRSGIRKLYLSKNSKIGFDFAQVDFLLTMATV